MVEASRQPAHAFIVVRGDDDRAARAGARDRGFQNRTMPHVGRAEAEVDHGGAACGGLVDRANQRGDVGGERLPEHLDDKDVRVRRLLADGRGDGSAVAESIDVLVHQRAVLANADAARHAAHVRMGRVHAAVDDRDQDAFPGVLG